MAGTDLTAANDRVRTRWRLANCGFVFQLGDLVPELTLLGVSGVGQFGVVDNSVLVADCASLRTVYTGSGSCVDGERYSVPDSDAAGPELPIAERSATSTRSFTEVVTLAALPSADLPPMTTTVLIDGGVPAADRVRALLGARAPPPTRPPRSSRAKRSTPPPWGRS